MKKVCFAAVLVMLVACSALGGEFEELLKSAKRGDAYAQYCLGDMYFYGDGVKQDYRKAREWFEKAATQDELTAQCYLGDMYLYGLGVKQDYNKAHEWYRKAAANGDEDAKEYLEKLAELGTSQTAAVQPEFSHPAAPPITAQNDSFILTHNAGSIFANNNSRIKPRLAVLDFEDKSEERKANPDTIRTSMVTALHKTDIFNLQERERLGDLKDELTLGQSGLMDASTAAKIGKLRGAQYVMMGAITLCYYSEKASGFIFPVLGFETRAKTAYVVIDIRIVEVETGDIVYTESKIGEASNKTKKNIAQSEKMIGGLLDMATRNAVEKHVSAIQVLGFHS